MLIRWETRLACNGEEWGLCSDKRQHHPDVWMPLARSGAIVGGTTRNAETMGATTGRARISAGVLEDSRLDQLTHHV
jgi:hypothetical protein